MTETKTILSHIKNQSKLILLLRMERKLKRKQLQSMKVMVIEELLLKKNMMMEKLFRELNLFIMMKMEI